MNQNKPIMNQQKQRPIHELLFIVRELGSVYFRTGLCRLISTLASKEIIHIDEYHTLNQYLENNQPIYTGMYWFEKGYWYHRELWLTVQYQLESQKFYKDFPLNTKVRVVNGGYGARGANDFEGYTVTKEEALKVTYNGEYREEDSLIYVSNGKETWGLCPGFFIQELKLTRWERFKAFAKDLLGLGPR